MFDHRFDQLMGRFGFIAGAFLVGAAAVGLLIALRLGRPPRMVLVALTGAALAGGLLFLPAAPRIVKALWRLTTAPPAPGPSGPLPVESAQLELLPRSGQHDTIAGSIWFPAVAAQSDSHPGAKSSPTPIDCAAVARLSLAAAPSRYPVLLYAPGLAGARDDNASTAASLASHGYVVIAIDDLDHGRQADSAILPTFDFSSEAAYESTLRRGAEKAALEARQALDALDRLKACANADWRERVEFDRVGFFGFSYGGAVAALAGIIDPRVAATANLDGFVFGSALSGSIEKPYLLLIEDEPVPTPRTLNASDPNIRFYAVLQRRFLQEHARLLQSPDKFGFRFRNVEHPGFTDQAFSRGAFRSWLFADPAQVKGAKDAYLLAFFDAYLRGKPQALLTQTPPPFRGVDALKTVPHWFDDEERRPMQVWLGLR